MEVAFAFGSDGLDAPATFAAAKEIAKRIVRESHAKPKNTLFAAIFYDVDAYVKLRFDSGSDKRRVLNAIDSIVRSRQGSNLTRALEVARDQLFWPRSNREGDVQQSLVLFLDKLNETNPALENVADDLKKKGVKLIIVALGPEAKKTAVEGVVKDPKNVVKPSKLADNTDEVISDVAHLLKPGKYFLFSSVL